jgi:hypothetical protein
VLRDYGVTGWRSEFWILDFGWWIAAGRSELWILDFEFWMHSKIRI